MHTTRLPPFLDGTLSGGGVLAFLAQLNRALFFAFVDALKRLFNDEVFTTGKGCARPKQDKHLKNPERRRNDKNDK